MAIPFLEDLQKRMSEEASRQAGMATSDIYATSPTASTQDLGSRAQDVASNQAANIAESTTSFILKVALVGGIFAIGGLFLLHHYDRK